MMLCRLKINAVLWLCVTFLYSLCNVSSCYSGEAQRIDALILFLHIRIYRTPFSWKNLIVRKQLATLFEDYWQPRAAGLTYIICSQESRKIYHWHHWCVILDRANISLSSAASMSFIISTSLWCLSKILDLCFIKCSRLLFLFLLSPAAHMYRKRSFCSPPSREFVICSIQVQRRRLQDTQTSCDEHLHRFHKRSRYW